MNFSWTELKKLCSEALQLFPINKIDPELSFIEAGLDSLDTAAVLMKIEEKYEFSIPAKDLNDIKTFQQLLDYSNNKLSQ